MIVTVHAKPNAKKNSIEWVDEDTIIIAVTQAPEKGRANNAIQKILAENFKIAKTSVHLIRGATTRIKQFEVKTKKTR